MNTILRGALRRSSLIEAALGLAIVVLLAGACGGQSSVAQAPSGGSAGASAGGSSGTPGSVNPRAGGSSGKSASGGAGSGDAGSNGSGAAATGGSSVARGGGAGQVEMPPPIGPAGAAGSAGEAGGVCDSGSLWAALDSLVIGDCKEASPTLGEGEHLSKRRGALVVDDQGAVIDNTGLSGVAKQQWLDQLGAQRWPCLAGQTIGYKCTVGG